MVNQQVGASHKSSFGNRWVKRSVAIGIFLALLLVFDLSPFGRNIRFYMKWADCGQRPYVANPTMRMEGDPIYYGEAPTFALVRGSRDMFCTPLEAEQAGFSANPDYYEFPHLNK